MRQHRPKLTVLLPCYNEEQALPALLDRLERVRPSLLPRLNMTTMIVDDGSTDATASYAGHTHGEMPVTVVRHEQNRGLGAAVDTGIRFFIQNVTNKPGSYLCVMDADGTHPPELIPALLNRMTDENLDVVIASRYAPGGGEHGLSALRLLYSRLASLAMRVCAPVRGARDYSCGFRLYRDTILHRGRERFGDSLITERSFVCMAELLVKLGRVKARVGEVGLDLHYELKQGASKMNVAATIRRYAVFAFRALLDPRFR